LIFQEVLGSILKATDAGSGSCNQATGLRAFSLFCRLSIHLQNTVWLFFFTADIIRKFQKNWKDNW